MHVPDGFIGPQSYLPAAPVALLIWAIGLGRLKRQLTAKLIPRLAVMTALAFVLMMISIPLPGGTSVHASGIAVMTILVGPWIAFIAVTLVLIMQALVFGVGGLTALPVNTLCLAFGGAMSAAMIHHLFRRRWEPVALFLAGWFSVVVPAVLLAVILGLQPRLACDASGAPLFFPFGLEVTLPAIVIPHLLIGIGEGLLTMFLVRLFNRRQGGI